MRQNRFSQESSRQSTHQWQAGTCADLRSGTTDKRGTLKQVLLVQAVAKNFTMLLAGVVVNAIASSVVQNITFAVLSDILPPEQLG